MLREIQKQLRCVKKTLTRRARPACVGSLPVTESYSLSSCLRFRAQLSYAVLYIKCGRSESASTCRESEVGHSSLDVECVAVPRTHDPRPAVALFDVTLVQRTSCRKTLQLAVATTFNIHRLIELIASRLRAVCKIRQAT